MNLVIYGRYRVGSVPPQICLSFVLELLMVRLKLSDVDYDITKCAMPHQVCGGIFGV